MATKADTPYPGARKGVPNIGTAALTSGEDWRKGQKEVEANKYTPDPNRPQPKGREGAVGVSTAQAIDRVHAEEPKLKDAKYTDPKHDKWAVPEANKPKPKSTYDALKQLQEKEEIQEKAARETREKYLATVQAQADGTFQPAEDPPTSLDELKKTKDPAADFAAGQSVEVGGAKYKWTKAKGWEPA